MSKFSSYKQGQLLFENWRRHVNESLEDRINPDPDDMEQAGYRLENPPSLSAEDLARAILGGYQPYGGSQSDEDVEGLAYLLNDVDLEAIGSYLEGLEQQEPTQGDVEAAKTRPTRIGEQAGTVSPKVSSIGKLLDGITAEEAAQVQALLSQAMEENPL